MSDIKKWGSDERQKFTDTSKGKITYDRAVFDGVVADVSMFKAAPDLYKALEELFDRENVEIFRTAIETNRQFDLYKWADRAMLALKKARGECHE